MKVSIAWNSKSYSDELLRQQDSPAFRWRSVQIWLAVWSFVKSENRIMPFGRIGLSATISNLCKWDLYGQKAQAQQGILRRLFQRNRNDIEQEASLTSFPREIPSLLSDGCSEFCRLMESHLYAGRCVPPSLCQNLLTGRSAEGSSVALWGSLCCSATV